MSRTGLLGFFRSAGLGLLLLGVALWALFGFVGGGAFVMIGVIWLLVGNLVAVYYRRVNERQAADRRLFDTGERAVAVIEKVEATAMAVNHMPAVKVTLRVQRSGGGEFTHTEKIVTLPTAVPVPGQVVDVAFDPGDLSNVALDVDPRLSAPPGVVLRTRPGQAEGDKDDDEVDLDRLERLAKLHREGVLTDAEFAEQKARLLEGGD